MVPPPPREGVWHFVGGGKGRKSSSVNANFEILLRKFDLLLSVDAVSVFKCKLGIL